MGSAVASEEAPVEAGGGASGNGAPPEAAGAGEGSGHPPAGRQAAGTGQSGDSSAAMDAASQTAMAAAATQAATTTSSGTSEGVLRREADERIAEQPGGGGSGGGPGSSSNVVKEPATPSRSNADSVEGAEGGVQVEKRNEYSACCRWSLTEFSKIKARALWSRYFEVGGYDCRLLVYPRGECDPTPLQLISPLL